jgi:CubicO group peptidase (beta-lactamase class C family)
MKDGEVVFERYERGWTADRVHPLASGTKSFTGVVAMLAVQDGLLTLDELASDTLREWKEDPRRSRITVRHLLTLSSGLDPADRLLGGRGGGRLLGEGVQDRNQRLGPPPRRIDDHFAEAIKTPAISEPGTRFRYGPSHFYAFGALLERKLAASGREERTFLEYMKARLFDPIGLDTARLGRDAAGKPNLPGGCLLTARQWAKFGEFVRLEGSCRQADGSLKPILKPELLAECFKPSAANPAYGLTWWLGGAAAEADGGIAEPDRAAGAATPRPRVYMAAGLGKQRLYVVPEQGLVVVRFAEATRQGRAFSDTELLGLIAGPAPAATSRPSGERKAD